MKNIIVKKKQNSYAIVIVHKHNQQDKYSNLLTKSNIVTKCFVND